MTKGSGLEGWGISNLVRMRRLRRWSSKVEVLASDEEIERNVKNRPKTV